MNLLLLESNQLIDACAVPNDRQTKHLCDVLKVADGDHIKVGCIDGFIGKGTIRIRDKRVLITDITLDTKPPPQLPITLLLAMPRPQMLKRILQTVSCMGVSRLCFIQTGRVEKSFWQSPVATEQSIRHHLTLGLEQAMATQLPSVEKYQRFRPFVEDNLIDISANSLKFIAHPGSQLSAEEHDRDQTITLAIGPEGGFLDKEVDAFVARGFEVIHFGGRILRVETAVTVALAKLFKLRPGNQG